MIFEITLTLLSICLLGIGSIFVWIDFRTPMGIQFRYFATQLLIFPIMVIFSQCVLLPGLKQRTYLTLNQFLHVVTLIFIVNSVYFLSKISKTHNKKIFLFFASIALLCLPLLFTPWMMVLDLSAPLKTAGGQLYTWFFIPYSFLYVITIYFFLIKHLRNALPDQRKFSILHLISWTMIGFSGLINVVLQAFPILYFRYSEQLIPLSLVQFGFMCAYFFVDQFLSIVRDRNTMFGRLETLTLNLEHLKPMGLLGENAAHISHEIKNYVSILRANNLLLQKKFSGNESLPEMERITRSTQRLEGFARSILDFSKGSHPASMETLWLDELIQNTVRNHFPERHDQILIAADDPVSIKGVSVSLEQVFVNLLRNSFEAAATEIKIRMFAKEGTRTVLLEDNGSGCTTEVVSQMGSPFFTTKKGRGGTGLGLAISKAIIQSHGGTLEATTKNQGGSDAHGMVFYLTFK